LTILSCLKRIINRERFGFQLIVKGTRQELKSPSNHPLAGECYIILATFLKTISNRFSDLEDDLLASVLSLLLKAPRALFYEKDVIKILKSALGLGLTHFPLASDALDVLERWTSATEERLIRFYQLLYKDILPCLCPYLTLEGDSSDVESTERKKKVAKYYLRGPMKENLSLKSLKLQNLQLRIVDILGKVGGEFNRAIVESGDTRPDLAVWDIEKRLMYSVPFKEVNLRIDFDSLLPRIILVAETSPDRKIRVAASELFHSILILMIGRTANMGTIDDDEGSLTPLSKIYRKVFPALIRLSGDFDSVPRDLLRPV
jgi:DNA-dependent protein kinase catalytic subunit